jgi:ABC-type nickel/cobalt efflux system permease component RcnA
LTWRGIYPAAARHVGDFRPSIGYYVSLMTPLLMAVLLGLRHATDPDHLTAVSTLLLSQKEGGARRAAVLGLAWGLGHATTLTAFGLPVILFSRLLTEPVQRAAEALVGALIILLAVRLLWRWKQGYFHVHPHRHGSVYHVHPHVHTRSNDEGDHPLQHAHSHPDALGRSPAESFGIGLLHGVGGSAGAGVLLVGMTGGKIEGVVALLVFAGATAVSMSLLSIVVAHALARGAVRRRLHELVPILGTAGVLFGAWYSLAALRVWP